MSSLNTIEWSSLPIPDPSPTELWRTYKAKFPETLILDVCWAANQRWREWTPWIKGMVENGAETDTAFREVLTSNKQPADIRDEKRPKDWQ
jgi:hypothetical protein